MSLEYFYRRRLDDNLKNYTRIYLISTECMEWIIHYLDMLPEEIL